MCRAFTPVFFDRNPVNRHRFVSEENTGRYRELIVRKGITSCGEQLFANAGPELTEYVDEPYGDGVSNCPAVISAERAWRNFSAA
jgi:hypothetical protein